MRPSLCRLGAVLLVLSISCSKSASSTRERRELHALDGAIAAWTNAAPEDRAIRLDEIESMEIQTERVRQLLDLCVGAFRQFLRSNELLGKARQRTLEVESAVVELRSRRDAGVKLDSSRESELTAMSREAKSTLEELNRSLNKAEEMVMSCDRRRKQLKDQINRL